MEETVRWYVGKLGGRVTFTGEFRGSKVFYLDVGETTFVIFGRLAGENPLPPSRGSRFGLDHFGFAIDDLDGALAELRAKDVRALEGPLDVRPGLRVAYIEGPELVRIELSERKPV